MENSVVAQSAKNVVIEGAAPLRSSKLPMLIRFPLLVLLSASLSALMYAQAAQYVDPNLALVSRNLGEWWEVGALVAWRV